VALLRRVIATLAIMAGIGITAGTATAAAATPVLKANTVHHLKSTPTRYAGGPSDWWW
jgi:hypothetical protein